MTGVTVCVFAQPMTRAQPTGEDSFGAIEAIESSASSELSVTAKGRMILSAPSVRNSEK